MPVSDDMTLKAVGAKFDLDANKILRALVTTLPGGTIDRLIAKLLMYKSTHFVVAHEQPVSTEVRMMEWFNAKKPTVEVDGAGNFILTLSTDESLKANKFSADNLADAIATAMLAETSVDLKDDDTEELVDGFVPESVIDSAVEVLQNAVIEDESEEDNIKEELSDMSFNATLLSPPLIQGK